MTSSAVLCVYYKVDAAQHAACAAQVRLFQAQLLAVWPGLLCELLQRPEAAAGVETWMETYRHADGQAQAQAQAQGLNAALIDHIEKAAAAAGLPTPRHSERFVALRSGA